MDVGTNAAIREILTVKENGLDVLDISNMGLTELPKEMLVLKDQLRTLVLGEIGDTSKNRIENFRLLKEFPKLEMLILGAMGISSTKAFSFLTQLTHLDLYYASIGDTDEIERLVNLRYLRLTFSNVKRLGNNGVMPGLTSLELDYTHLFDPGDLKAERFPQLTSLSMAGNGRTVKTIPVLGDMKKLTTLNLNRQKLEDISFLSRLQHLQYLYLADNLISDIDPLRKLSQLTILDLTGNKIKDLSALADLQRLIYLYLATNEIEDLSPLSELQNADEIGLAGNKISNIRPLEKWLRLKGASVLLGKGKRKHSSKRKLDLKDNPITDPPVQYLEGGRDAILSYWEQQGKMNRQRDVNEAKLIIVGNSHVGKSTLAYLLQNGKLPATHLPSTHGLEFGAWTPAWTIAGKRPTINIIDFGGQEYYHDTHHLFFNDQAVFVLLWEPDTNDNIKKETPVGDRSRSEWIRHFKVEYWLNAVELYAGSTDALPTASVLLVQTYVDKHGKRFLNLEDLKNRYPLLGDTAHISLANADSLGSAGEILQMKIRSLFEQMPKKRGQRYDESWITIRKYIEQEESRNFRMMTIAEFREWFIEHGKPDIDYGPEAIRILCITLNYWGVVLYRYEITALRDVVIVNPQYFIQHVNKLLTEKVRETNGVIARKEIPGLLQMDPSRVDAFIAILKEFKILFSLPGTNEKGEPKYIAPMYLQEKPAYVDLFLSQFVPYYRIRFEGYFHKGILLDCFQEFGPELMHDGGVYFYWQWGMVLRRGSRIVCIEFDEDHLDQVLIRTVRNDNEKLGREPFLQEVLQSFQTISEKYKVRIELSPDGVSFVDREALLVKMKAGLNKFDYNGRKLDTRDFYFLLDEKDTSMGVKRVFVSYSSKDRKHLDELESHLKLYQGSGLITYWNDLFLTERSGWDEQIKEEMEKANVLIMLLSPDYLATDYIRTEEIPFALTYLGATISAKQVFWILLRPCNYGVIPEVSKYTIYPLKEKGELAATVQQWAITEYSNTDRQWVRLLKLMFG